VYKWNQVCRILGRERERGREGGRERERESSVEYILQRMKDVPLLLS